MFREKSFKNFLILCFVFGFSQIVLTERQEFCQLFAENGFQIDYGFETDLWKHHFLAIGYNYWEIDWYEERARLLSGLSKTSDLLGNHFRNAFLSNFSIDGKQLDQSMIGRLFKNNDTIDWISVRFNETTEELVRSVAKNESIRTQIEFEADFIPSVSLVASLGITCFLQQKTTEKSIVFEKTYHCYNFDDITGNSRNSDNRVIEDLKTTMDRKNISYGSDQTILNKLMDSREVIAIYTELHFSDFRYLFLFKDKETITYCLTDFIDFNKECTEEPQILISCSGYGRHRTQTSLRTTLPIDDTFVINVEESSHTSIWTTNWWHRKDVSIVLFGLSALIIFSFLLWKTTHKTQPIPQNLNNI